jgi:hypothetical protein
VSADGKSISLSLISHTNAGKTTLARTLLGSDVGEVRDAPHVTQDASVHTMVETDRGDRLRLWDTPGFGDSARLAKRLAQQGNPIGWFLSQVWDRFRDRPLWLSQQAVRNVREQADVVLYLVNASEDPADTGYLEPEMQVLGWIGRPVVVLLNQTGRPRPRDAETAEEDRWRAKLAPYAFVKAVLTLDAFARCWVQEITLLRAVGAELPADRKPAFERLAAAWQARRMAQFDASMDAIAQPIARAACDRAPVADEGLRSRLRDLGKAIGIGRDGGDSAQERAMLVLAERLDRDLRASTDALIAIHGLEGRAAGDVLARLAKTVTTEGPVSEGKAAVVGGFLSGALSGLVADLASGGLTLGAGMLAGGLLGALGGAGIARGYNVARGTEETSVRWSDAFLDGLVHAALLRYLAVAHYGRGRGEWTETEYPGFWRDLVARAVERHRAAFDDAWRARTGGNIDAVAAPLRGALHATAQDALGELYPGALREDATPAVAA